MANDPYKVLGISPGATQDEVKKAYRKKARENHPDLNPNDPAAAERMNQVNEAYDRIMNPEKYEAADRRAAQASGQPGYGNPYGGAGYGGSGQGSSGQGTYQGYGYGGGSGQYGWAGGMDWEDIFGFGYTGAYSSDPIHPEVSAGDPAEFVSAINDINAGRYSNAINTLNQVISTGRTARWYYLSALANQGAGNNLMAIEQIRRAIRLDPNNLDYQRAQRQFQHSGQTYQQQGTQRGFTMTTVGPEVLCCGCLAANMLCCGPMGLPILCCL